MNMANVYEYEKLMREVDKTSESICKKHRALKTDRNKKDMALDGHFKSIIYY